MFEVAIASKQPLCNSHIAIRKLYLFPASGFFIVIFQPILDQDPKSQRKRTVLTADLI